MYFHKHVQVRDHSFFMHRRCSGFWRGHLKIFELKGRGGSIPKIDGGGGHASRYVLYWFDRGTQDFCGKIGEGGQLMQ